MYCDCSGSRCRFSHLRPVCQPVAVFVLLLMWDDGNTVGAVSVHTRVVVATESTITKADRTFCHRLRLRARS